jgi:hypothetical protein
LASERSDLEKAKIRVERLEQEKQERAEYDRLKLAHKQPKTKTQEGNKTKGEENKERVGIQAGRPDPTLQQSVIHNHNSTLTLPTVRPQWNPSTRINNNGLPAPLRINNNADNIIRDLTIDTEEWYNHFQ